MNLPAGRGEGDASVLSRLSWRRMAATIGPGLVVMLADTEAGSVISAAQGGAAWGYRLLLPQLLLIPALFMAQNLAGRLGIATRCGLAELVLRRSGRVPAALLLAVLTISCISALITQLSGLAGIGELFGVPVWQTSAVAALGLISIIWTSSYRSVELMAIATGACELAFIALAWLSRPDPAEMLRQSFEFPLGDSDYLTLLAASIGTCVIPWALAYQQSASIGKELGPTTLSVMRAETLIGAIFCQIVTGAVIVAAAAAFHHGSAAPVRLDQVGEIAQAFTAVIGPQAGRLVFAVGLSSGALIAAVVVCLTAAWTFGEVAGLRRTLSERPARAPWLPTAFSVVLAAAAVLVASGVNLVRLSVAAGVVNALVLPVMLGFMFHAARYDLPPALRPQGRHTAIMAIVFVLTAATGLYASLAGMW